MKANKISIEADGFKMKATPERLVQLLIAGLFAQALPPAAPVQPLASTVVPALGAEWPGQGGVNGGLIAEHGGIPAHYLIIAKEDVGSFEWGGRGKESVATSKTDGRANTSILYGNSENHPAAKASADYQADGHTDFYLPACAELYHCWVNVPELFAKDAWYWSSTQRSADIAFYMYFGDGNQTSVGKSFELRVRPVRRFFI